MKSALLSVIAGLPDVAARIGARVRWGLMPTELAVLPYVTLTEAELPREYSTDGDSGQRRSLVQVDVWGADADEVMPISDAIAAGLTGYIGDVSGTRFRAVRIDGIRDFGGGLADLVPAERRVIDLIVKWEALP